MATMRAAQPHLLTCRCRVYWQRRQEMTTLLNMLDEAPHRPDTEEYENVMKAISKFPTEFERSAGPM